ncbi:MAG: 30S ribosomal protein S16, partial [Microcoleaceae cyanobacterium]
VPAIVRRLQQGAQPTRTVRNILQKANVFEQLKSGVNPESTTSTEADEAISTT